MSGPTFRREDAPAIGGARAWGAPGFMSSTARNFAAHRVERLYEAPEGPTGDVGRRTAAFVVAAAFYALLTVAITVEGRFPPPPPTAEEVPVEIVVEQRSPEAEEQPPPLTNLDEKPATDAPRAGSSDKDTGDEDKPDKAPPPPAPAPSPEAAKPTAAEAQAPATPPNPPTPIENAEETAPPPTPAPQTVAKAEPEAPAKPAPMFASLPDIDFGGAAMRSPVSGGHAKATYLSMVYGRVMAHFRRPPDAAAAVGRGRGAVVFSVDARGDLVNRWVDDPSGSPDLDRAAFNAVGAGSPFPPPPTGGMVQLRFVYSAQ